MPTDLLILLSPKNLILFVLIFTRLGGMLLTAPIFSNFPVPVQIKVWFIAFIAFIMFPMVQAKSGFAMPTDMITLTIIMLKEFMIGFIIGFISNIVFIAVEMGAELLALQTGLSAGMALNPLSGDTSSVLTSVYMILAAFVFIGINGYQWLFASVYRSFQTVPLGFSFIFTGTL